MYLRVEEERRIPMSFRFSSELGGRPAVVSTHQITFTGPRYRESAIGMASLIGDRVVPSKPQYAGFGPFVIDGTSGTSPEEQEPSSTVCFGYVIQDQRHGELSFESLGAYVDEVTSRIVADATEMTRERMLQTAESG